jgi:hypothetical protein
MSDEEDIVEFLLKNHKSTMGVLKERQRNLNIIQTLWTNKNFKVYKLFIFLINTTLYMYNF